TGAHGNIPRRTGMNWYEACWCSQRCGLPCKMQDAIADGSVFVLRHRNDTELLQHAQIVSHRTMFDGFSVPEAHERHMGLLKGTTGRSYPQKRTEMGTTHGHSACNRVPFGHQVLNCEVEIREGGAQHPDGLPSRFRASIIHAHCHLVIEEVRRDQVVYDGEVALVEHFLKGT